MRPRRAKIKAERDEAVSIEAELQELKTKAEKIKADSLRAEVVKENAEKEIAEKLEELEKRFKCASIAEAQALRLKIEEKLKEKIKDIAKVLNPE